MIEVGTVLQNRYRIERQIGQGGMGKVYVATDERFNSTVAIKETVFQDKNLRKAFEREARLLNSLKHLALPRVSDHFIEGDGQFLVMEFVAGEDLAEMMERHGEAFAIEKVLNWTRQLCDALDYLHAQDIIHRDIKPQNLKLTPGGQIVLLDFGLAKGTAADSQQTAAKSIFGYSRSYASLEQIQGTGTEPRSDLYSLGATVYHLLTGIPPVDALTRAMNVLNAKSDPLIPANLINNQVPPAVAEILQKTMALNASERPASAAVLRQMLEECDKSLDASANAATVIDPILQSSLPTDLLMQETKIKPADTNVTPAGALSHAQTAISEENESKRTSYQTRVETAPDNESKVTRVRLKSAGAEQQQPKATKSRARAVAATAVGGLLLACSALAAVYFYDSPKTAESNSNSGTATEFKVVVSNAENENKETANTSSANVNLTAQENPVTSQPQKQNVSKLPETAKRAKNQTASERADEAKADAKVNETEHNVVVSGDRVETEEMIVDENGIRMKNPRPAPRFPNRRGSHYRPLPPEAYRTLTPEQIRRLERLRNIKPGVVVVKPPPPMVPKPTP